MIAGRIIAGVVAGACIATAALVAPAFGAVERPAPRAVKRLAARPVGGFTPAAGDPRLAALFARSGIGAEGFRFTPAETRGNARDVTVAIGGRVARSGDRTALAQTAPTVGVAPIAYSLGASVGYKRLALSGDVSRVDPVLQPGGREGADVALSYSAPRWTGRVRASADRPVEGTPRAIVELPSYSVDLGGSYALTRNLDLTAGVRYRSERERLTRDTAHHDSQAVYVGTAFRF